MNLKSRSELKEQKKTLRSSTLAKRKALYDDEPDVFTKYSQQIIETLKQTEEYQNARIIMCFVSFKDEVETHEFIKNALVDGKKIYVPYITKLEKIMVPAEILNFEEDLSPGYYDILSPKEDTLRIKDKSEIDLIVTPGVIFDDEGFRIGYGAGFYDRFLSQINQEVPKIGIAFSLQQTKELPRDEFDISVDKLITEKGITVFKK